jgi:hypothetical protein
LYVALQIKVEEDIYETNGVVPTATSVRFYRSSLFMEVLPA